MKQPKVTGDPATGLKIDKLAVVITGNPLDGTTIYGPFDSAEEANHWADGMDDDWWVTTLETPLGKVSLQEWLDVMKSAYQ